MGTASFLVPMFVDVNNWSNVDGGPLTVMALSLVALMYAWFEEITP